MVLVDFDSPTATDMLTPAARAPYGRGPADADVAANIAASYTASVSEANTPPQYHTSTQSDVTNALQPTLTLSPETIPRGAGTPPQGREARPVDSAARDETLSGITEYVKAMCKHYTPAVRDAALRVTIVGC